MCVFVIDVLPLLVFDFFLEIKLIRIDQIYIKI